MKASICDAELVSASYFFRLSGIKTLKQVQGDGDGLFLHLGVLCASA
jgi:hypothetical protein